MMDWLNETDDAPADIELWGFESGVYQWAIFKLLSNVVENHWRIQMMNQMGQKHRQRRRRLTRRPRPRPRGSQGPKQHHRVERSQKVKRIRICSETV